MLQRMGVLPGVSDFVLVSPPHGQFHALELKRKGEEPSEEQTDPVGRRCVRRRLGLGRFVRQRQAATAFLGAIKG